ncbi:MAG TPA: hypothetical protein VMV29_06000 [Ktedonobacterales bacterium]|nr:hypothetical protein [Ktedonobacterales bacterium]
MRHTHHNIYMDEIVVTPLREDGPDWRATDEEVSLGAEVWVNGRRMPNVFDLAAWFPAIAEDGLAPLFTCGCSIFGCGGYNVDIERTPDAWVWRNRYAPITRSDFAEWFGEPIPWDRVRPWLHTPRDDGSSRILETFEYRFPWDAVDAITARLLGELRQFAARYPDRRLVSYGGWDLSALVR